MAKTNNSWKAKARTNKTTNSWRGKTKHAKEKKRAKKPQKNVAHSADDQLVHAIWPTPTFVNLSIYVKNIGSEEGISSLLPDRLSPTFLSWYAPGGLKFWLQCDRQKWKDLGKTSMWRRPIDSHVPMLVVCGAILWVFAVSVWSAVFNSLRLGCILVFASPPSAPVSLQSVQSV